MSTTTIGECGTWVSGGTPRKSVPEYWNGEIPWISAKSLKQFDLSDSEDRVTALGAKQVTIVPPGTIIFVVRGMSLAKEFRVGLTTREVTFNQDLRAIIPAENVDARYLTRIMHAAAGHILGRVTNAGHGTKRLPTEDLKRVKIPLPPLSEQKRIAGILDKADSIRRKRQQAIGLTEQFLRSTFLDMFGDPVTNPKGWPTGVLGKTATRITKGESPKWQGFDYQDVGVRFITSENVLWGELNIDKPKFIPEAFHAKLSRSQIAPDDVLINLVGASVGRTCIVPESALPANVNQAVAVISLDHASMLPSFLLHQFLTHQMQRELLGNVVDSARANISLTNVKECEVVLPPIELQQTWDDTFQRLIQLRSKLERECSLDDNLFNSLVQRAFRGEL